MMMLLLRREITLYWGLNSDENLSSLRLFISIVLLLEEKIHPSCYNKWALNENPLRWLILSERYHNNIIFKRGGDKSYLGDENTNFNSYSWSNSFISRLMLAKSSDKNQMNFSNNNNDEVKMKNRRNKL
jgi:hypothetical protein